MSTPTERFQQLLRVLRTVQAEMQMGLDGDAMFDMDTWYENLELANVEWPPFNVAKGPTCGTSACAAGWACMDLWFILDGLYLDDYFDPHYEEFWGFDALEAYFGLTVNAAQNLFSIGDADEQDNSIEAVIARIETYMHEHGMPLL